MQEDEVGSLIDDGENRVMSPAATVTIGNASGNQHVYFVTDKTQLALLQACEAIVTITKNVNKV